MITFSKYLKESYPDSFSFEEFNKIRTYNGKLKYANQSLRKLSSGSARVVYQVNDKMVLKIAKNKKGLAQNAAESDWSVAAYDVTAKVFNNSEDFFWVEMELAKKLTPTRFKELAGLSIQEMQMAMSALRDRMQPSPYGNKKLDSDFEKKLYESEFYMDIERFVVD